MLTHKADVPWSGVLNGSRLLNGGGQRLVSDATVSVEEITLTPEDNMTTRVEAIAALTAPGQPFELRVVNNENGPIRVFTNAPLTLRDLYRGNINDKTFVVFEDERYTFAQTYQQAAKIARILIDDFGVQKGDRVAISMRNFPEWVMAFSAITSIGAIAVAMNALWQPEEMEYGLTDSGAKVLFADQERLDRLAHCSPELQIAVIAVRPSGPTSTLTVLSDRLAGMSEVPMPDADIDADDPATIFYTSGSTGHPKGVLQTHRNIVSALFSWELDARIANFRSATAAAPVVPGQPESTAKPEPSSPAPQAATLLAVPLFHATGSHGVYLQSYRAQRKLVSMYKWDPEVAAMLIERERINSFVAPSAITGDLVRVARTSNRDLTSLRMVGGGGAARAPEQVRQIDASFKKARPNTGWGMTETNAIGTGIAGQDYIERPESAGHCSAIMDLKVIDDRGNELPTGQRGELLVRGTCLFPGYWNKPEVNAEVFLNGWFRTGDVAYIDAEGFLYIVDRIKDLIIRGGENIGCGQVEAALMMHPDVHEAAVYAVPDERLGEEVGATIYANPSINLDELREFLLQHLARFEVPRYIATSDTALPRTASGKILKRQLREEAGAKL